MTGVDWSELLLLLLIGLIVLGPKRLPEIANKIGGWIGQARRMTRVMKRQLEDELQTEDFKLKPFEPHVPSDDDTYSPIHGENTPTPRVGGMPVQSNVPASDVHLPDEEEDDTVAPPPGDTDKPAA